jgi:hypothetical protein
MLRIYAIFFGTIFFATIFFRDFFCTPAAAVVALADSVAAAFGWILFSGILLLLCSGALGAERCRHHRRARHPMAVPPVTDPSVLSTTVIT